MLYAPPNPLLDFVNEPLVAGELIALNGLTDEGVIDYWRSFDECPIPVRPRFLR